MGLAQFHMLQGAPKHGAYLAHVIRETVLGFSWQQDGSWGPDSLASPRLVLPYLFSLLGVREFAAYQVPPTKLIFQS